MLPFASLLRESARIIARYDGDGSRWKRLDEHGTIHYVGPYEKSLGNGREVAKVVTKHYQAMLGG